MLSQNDVEKMNQLKLFSNKNECFGCGACSAVCDAGAITMCRDEEGFSYPVLQETRCTNCRSCESVCPAKQKLMAVTGSRFYAVRCNDESLLQKSTSGGAFSLLAQEIIRQGGVVCGACFDELFRVKHVLSEEIDGMRKSKYVQSDTEACFSQVRDALTDGTQVFFTGTPCQCHALKRFLGENRTGLILCALVCRGVQSPGLWEDYVAWLNQRGPLEAYDFRAKRRLDDGHMIAYTVGGNETVVPRDEDALSRIYAGCLTYRPSCYTCPYCSPDNDFDFTLGDFWSIEKIHPKLADGKGTSLVISRSEHAENLMKAIDKYATVILCEEADAMQDALAAPPKQGMLRRFLFKDFAKKDSEGHCNIPLILKKYGAGGI